MKKVYFVLFIVLSIALLLLGQSIISPYNYQLINPSGGVAGTGSPVSTSWVNVQSSGANFHQLTWTTAGSPASCTIQVDYSNNGSTVTGQVVGSQSCTTNGAFLNTSSITPAFIRVTFNASVGSTVFYNAVGYMNLPTSSGGVITSGSITTNGTGAGSIALTQGPIQQVPANSWAIVANTVEPNSGVEMLWPSSIAQPGGVFGATVGTGAAGHVTCTSCGALVTGNIVIDTAGSGFVSFPACWVTGGGGSGATCAVSALSAGTIIAANVAITNGGSGYTSQATLNFSTNVDTSFSNSPAVNTTSYTGTTSGTINFGCSPATTCSNLTSPAPLKMAKALQNASGNWAGQCTMAAATTCTITITSAFTTPICVASQAGVAATPIAGECSVSGTTMTVTANASNSSTWTAIVVGNPN